jgi:hypothetical protein
MIVIGVLLVLIAVGAVAFVLMAPAAVSKGVELTAIGVTVNATPLASFVAGAMTVALLGLGSAMISQGARRKAKSRRELRQLRKEQTVSGHSPTTAEERARRLDRPPDGSSTGSESTSPH